MASTYFCKSINGSTSILNPPVLARSFRVLSAEIPYVCYTITDANKTLVLNNGVATTTTITVPIGVYDISALCTAVQTALNAGSGVFSVTDWTCAVNPLTYLVTITSTTGTQNFKLVAGTTIGTRLGFTTIPTVLGTTVTAPSVYKLNPIYFDVRCDDLASSEKTYVNGVLTPNLIFRVQCDATYGNFIFYNPSEPPKEKLTGDEGKAIGTLAFSIMDDEGLIVDLHGLTFSCRIEFYP